MLTKTRGNILQFGIIVYKELSTMSCRVSYVPRLAKVVNVLAIRHVKQGTETTRFRIGFTLHMIALDLIKQLRLCHGIDQQSTYL